MAKSLGNYTHLADAIDAAGARAVRLLVLQTHYRKAMEMGAEALDAAASGISRLDAFARRAAAAGIPPEAKADMRRPDIERGNIRDLDVESVAAFAAAMDDDFSTPTALDVIFRLVRRANAALDAGDADAERCATTALHLLNVLGIAVGEEGDDINAGEGLADAEVEALLAQRAAARSDRDFNTADRIRDELADAGIVVADSPDGATWHRA